MYIRGDIAILSVERCVSRRMASRGEGTLLDFARNADCMFIASDPSSYERIAKITSPADIHLILYGVYFFRLFHVYFYAHQRRVKRV